MTIERVIKEWRAHLPPARGAGGSRASIAAVIARIAHTLVYAAALAVILGVPIAILVVAIRLAYG
jgi:hypothetical protein